MKAFNILIGALFILSVSTSHACPWNKDRNNASKKVAAQSSKTNTSTSSTKSKK